MHVIVKIKFGSHLYGTNTKDSDTDYKGIFLSSIQEIFLNRIPKSVTSTTKKEKDEGIKNSSEDIDSEFYSLHYFLKLACEGQTVALDMLHAPKNMILETSDIWERIIKEREKFYTKNLNAFICYARKQAAKYGIKGSRLDAAKQVMNVFKNQNQIVTLSCMWDELPEIEHCHHIETNPSGIKQYQMCGKILQETMGIDYAYDIVKRFYDSYGRRAKQAEKNEGIDWKAVSHAFRAAYQVKSILTKNTIIFPLPEADYLIKIKQGKINYKTEAGPKLDELMKECEELAANSKLPGKVNHKYWDDFIIDVISEKLVNDDYFR